MAIPRDIKAKRPQFFSDDGVDQLVSALTNLMAEHWVLKERVYVIEQLADERDLFDHDAIESYQLSDEQKADLAEARQRLLETVFINARVAKDE